MKISQTMQAIQRIQEQKRSKSKKLNTIIKKNNIDQFKASILYAIALKEAKK